MNNLARAAFFLLFAASASAQSLEALATEHGARFDLSSLRAVAPSPVAADASSASVPRLDAFVFSPSRDKGPSVARKCSSSMPADAWEGALAGFVKTEEPALMLPELLGVAGYPLAVAAFIALFPVALILGASFGAIYGCVNPECVSELYPKPLG